MKKIFILLGILLLITSCDYFTYNKYGKRSVTKDNFQGIDSLKLKGVVYDLKTGLNGFHGRGILRLNVIETNIDYYDPRDQQANYFCVIKDGKAEVYEITGKFRYDIGDTVYIDVKYRKLFYTNKNKNGERRIGIGSRQFFSKIQEKGYQDL